MCLETRKKVKREQIRLRPLLRCMQMDHMSQPTVYVPEWQQERDANNVWIVRHRSTRRHKTIIAVCVGTCFVHFALSKWICQYHRRFAKRENQVQFVYALNVGTCTTQ